MCTVLFASNAFVSRMFIWMFAFNAFESRMLFASNAFESKMFIWVLGLFDAVDTIKVCHPEKIYKYPSPF